MDWERQEKERTPASGSNRSASCTSPPQSERMEAQTSGLGKYPAMCSGVLCSARVFKQSSMPYVYRYKIKRKLQARYPKCHLEAYFEAWHAMCMSFTVLGASSASAINR